MKRASLLGELWRKEGKGGPGGGRVIKGKNYSTRPNPKWEKKPVPKKGRGGRQLDFKLRKKGTNSA